MAFIKAGSRNEPVNNNPEHKSMLSWRVTDDRGVHEIDYAHKSSGLTRSEHEYAMFEDHNGKPHLVGKMALDKSGRIQNIEIHPDRRRQGLASKLFEVGQEVHKSISSIPEPTHSEARTKEGDAWARAKGAKPAEERVPQSDYRNISFQQFGKQ